MSDGWAKHAWRNEWHPIASVKPEAGQLVEVWAFTDSIPAIYCADGQFRTRDGQQIDHITHWRNGPAETDGLLHPSPWEGPGAGTSPLPLGGAGGGSGAGGGTLSPPPGRGRGRD